MPTDPVRNIHFRNLTIQGSNWNMPVGGYIGTQAHFFHNMDGTYGAQAPAAVSFQNVRNSSIRYCEVRFTGANGIAMTKGCRNSSIEYNVLRNIGGTAIEVGLWHDDTGEKFDFGSTTASSDLKIRSNCVERYGRDILGAVGIWCGFVPNVEIRRNSVSDGHYTGISVGWEWSIIPTRLENVIIANNEVFDVLKSFHDGAGIYCLGNQGDGRITNNYIHDLENGNGFQFDNGSSFLIAKQNLIHDVANYGVQFNSGIERQVFNNIFAFTGEQLLRGDQMGLNENVTAFEFYRNVFFNDFGGLIMRSTGPQDLASIIAEYDHNIYFTTDGLDLYFDSYDFQDWQTILGHDFGSFDQVNPDFSNPDARNFDLNNPPLLFNLTGFVDWNKLDAGCFSSSLSGL